MCCLALVALALVAARPVAGQTLPSEAYRRSPLLTDDPFWPLMGSRGGLSITGRGAADNNALDFDEVGALVFLVDRDSLRAGDALDALGHVPGGEGLGVAGDGGAAVRLAMPLGRRLVVGLSAGARAWGSLLLDDAAVALLRDGNAARSEFALGRTRGEGLLAAEAGGHFTWRAGRILGSGGPEVTFGAGLRRVEPLYFAGFRSVLDEDDEILVSPDTIRARVSVAAFETPSAGRRGDGLLADAVVRAAWPGSRVALEASLTGLGEVRVRDVVRREERVDVVTTRLDTLVEVVEGLSLAVRDTVDLTLTPPARASVTASTWAIPGLQLDARLSASFGGDLPSPPPAVALLSTLRPVPALPLRAGVRVGGHGDIAYRAGLGWEGGRFFARVTASSAAGFFGGARGFATRVETGVWF